MTDVTIIGGGPAGCKTASLLSRDLDVTVVEEHRTSGDPVQCTGLISDDVVRLSDVNVDVLNSLYGMNVHFPGGGTISLRSKKRKAVLIDRSVLDRRMADAAADAGAVFRYGTRYLSHSFYDDAVRTETTGGRMVSRIIVGADGHSSAVARSLGGNEPKEYVQGIQFDIRNTMDDQEMIDILIGSEYAPGFFAWLIPFGDMTRVGLCSSGATPPIAYLKNILRRTGLQDSPVMKRYSGKIPLGGRRTTFGDGTLLIGDAAGQVKPISGGGLYPAFMSADPLAETVKEAIAADNVSSAFLRRYEKRWKKETGKELRNGYILRRMFTRMDNRSLNGIFDAADRDDIMEILNGMDLDRPSDIVLPMMKNIGAAAGAFPAILKGIVRGNR
jgi:geranylgeranyl reductase family protein